MMEMMQAPGNEISQHGFQGEFIYNTCETAYILLINFVIFGIM